MIKETHFFSKTSNENTNTFLKNHFFELKLRFQYFVFSFVILFLTVYYFRLEITYIFTKPFLCYIKYFIFTDLTEAFYTSINISLFFSLYIILPVLFYQLWCFFIPSKFEKKRKKINSIFFIILFIIICSFLFVYFVLLPKFCFFFVTFQINTNLLNIQLEARIQSYVQIVSKLYILSTFFFLQPLIFFYTIKYKYIKLTYLTKIRKKIFFCLLILFSIISPPEFFTMIYLTLFFFIFIEFLFLLGFFYHKLTN